MPELRRYAERTRPIHQLRIEDVILKPEAMRSVQQRRELGAFAGSERETVEALRATSPGRTAAAEARE